MRTISLHLTSQGMISCTFRLLLVWVQIFEEVQAERAFAVTGS